MARPYDRGKIEVSESFGAERGIPQEERPFNIALLGNFSGSDPSDKKQASLASRRSIVVDRDNFEQVLARISPTLQLPTRESEGLVLRFHELRLRKA